MTLRGKHINNMTHVITNNPKVLAEQKRRAPIVDFTIRLVKEKPMATVGGIIVILMFFIGIFANFLAPHEYDQMILSSRLMPPSSAYPLGTDQLGRDELTRIIYGARVSMIVGLAGATLTAVIATSVGLPSGFYGGKIDLITQRFVDGWMAFPPLFLVLSIMALVGPGLIQVIVVLGLLGGITQSRIVRSAVIGIKENVYIEAAKAVGASNRIILTRHVLPNIAAPIIIIFTLAMGTTILGEATLSFLGFGIPPPMPTWGSMLSGDGIIYMYQATWLAIWPGLALGLIVWGINVFGDGLRDLLDPRLRGGLGRYGSRKLGKKVTRKQG
jgi:peptide/nickel transport system permease protein